MTIKERINDLKLAFKVIGWYKENKDIFQNIGKCLRSLQSQINQVKESLDTLKQENEKGNK